MSSERTLEQGDIDALILRLVSGEGDPISRVIRDFYVCTGCWRVMPIKITYTETREARRLLKKQAPDTPPNIFLRKSCPCLRRGECRYILFSDLIKDILHGEETTWDYSHNSYVLRLKYTLTLEQRNGLVKILESIKGIEVDYIIRNAIITKYESLLQNLRMSLEAEGYSWPLSQT